MASRFRVWSPVKMKFPRLAAPTGVESVAIPTVQTVAVRSPAITTGRESGSSILQSCWAPVIPMPRAASRSAGSTARIPATVFCKIGRML
jgi:hypothetical protein